MKKTNNILLSAIFLLVILPYGDSFALCVNKEKAFLRSGPGTTYKKSWEVHRYTPLQKLSSKGKWVRVKDVDGDVHWVYSSLVTSKIKCGTIARNGGTNVRQSPSTSGKMINDPNSPIPKYASFRFVARKGKWVQLKDAAGTTFWVFGSNVWVQ